MTLLLPCLSAQVRLYISVFLVSIFELAGGETKICTIRHVVFSAYLNLVANRVESQVIL